MDGNLAGSSLNQTTYADWSISTANDHFSPLKQRVQGIATTGKGQQYQQQAPSLVCPLSPSRADGTVRPSTSAANGASDGGLSALQAALSSLGVRVHDTRPATAAATVSGILSGGRSTSAAAGAAPPVSHNPPSRRVLDISADIQRTVDSLNSIGSRLDHESSRGSLGVDNSSASLPQPQLSRPATGQVSAAGHRSGSPRRYLDDAPEEQRERLRWQLEQLNRSLLYHTSRPSTAASTAPPPAGAAAAAAGAMYNEPRPSTGATTPAPGGGGGSGTGSGSGSGSGGWGQLQSSSSQRQLGRERSLVNGGWAQTAAAVAAEGASNRAGPSMAPLSTYVQSPGSQQQGQQQQQQQQQAMGLSPHQRPGSAMEAVVGPLTAVASLRSLTAWQQQQPLLRQVTAGPDEPHHHQQQQQQQQQAGAAVAVQPGRPPSSGRHQRSNSGSSQQQFLSPGPHQQQQQQQQQSQPQQRPATSSRERLDPQHLASEVQSLQRQLHAKEQTESAALSALHKLSQSSRDERVQELQQQVRDLQQQLLARDTALAEAEAQLQEQGAASSGMGGGRGGGSTQGSPVSDRATPGKPVDAAIHKRLVEHLGERSLELQQLQEDMAQLQEEGQRQAASLTKRAETYRKQLLEVREQLDLQTATVQQLQDELAAAAAAAAAGGSRTARASNRERQLQQQLQQQAAEAQQLREALQQVCDAVRAADPGFAQQLASYSSSGSEDAANLALLLQQRLQQVLSQRSDATAEVEQLRQQLADATSAPVTAGDRPHYQQQQQQQYERVKQELQEAAQKLAAAESQLVELISVKQQCSSLKRQLAQTAQEREQHKQYSKVLEEQQKELLQQLPGSQPSAVQLIRDLQQQVAVAAAEVQQLKQQQRAAAVEQEAATQQQQQQQSVLQDRSMLSLRALASHSRRNSAHQLPQLLPGEAPEPSAELAALQQRCGELSQQLAAAQQQVAAVQAKEAKLQAANAQLQEQLCALKVTPPSVSTSAASLEATPSALHGSVTCSKPSSDDLAPEVDSINRIQMKLKDVGGARQQVSSLQQQLEEAVSRGEALAADNAALEEELGQWRVHADALEADLADLKEQVVEARDNHPIWVAERTRLEAATADKAAALAATQSELAGVRAALADSKSLVAQLEFELSTGAADYDTLLRRHQALEASHAKAQDSLAELRQRLEGLTGPGGPAAKAKQAQARVEQLQRRLDASQAELAAVREQQAALSQQLAGKEEEVLALEGQVAVLEAELGKRKDEH